MLGQVALEERDARAKQRRAQAAGREAAKARESERWVRFKDYARGKGCRCAIRRGMSHDGLCAENLAGRRPERRNCGRDAFVCPVLLYALEATKNGGRL